MALRAKPSNPIATQKHKQIEENIEKFHNPFGEDASPREDLKKFTIKSTPLGGDE